MEPKYELKLTNLEVKLMFQKIIRGWFKEVKSDYNDFVKALLLCDVKAMNAYMNRVTIEMFSSFDTGRRRPKRTEPERFYHGFVSGLLVELQGRYMVTSNRESGFGRYDVVLEPLKKEDYAYILEFKVHDSEEEETLKATVAAAHKQIEENPMRHLCLRKGFLKKKYGNMALHLKGKKF